MCNANWQASSQLIMLNALGGIFSHITIVLPSYMKVLNIISLLCGNRITVEHELSQVEKKKSAV